MLSLDSARQAQSGNYSCVAENLSGSSSLRVRVLVIGQYNCGAGGRKDCLNSVDR